MKIRIVIIALWASLLAACYEDKGNYDLVDYNKITIATVAAETKTTVVLGESVKITPKITWKYPERDTTENAFDFVWVHTWGGDTIAKTRVLEYTPDECGNFPCYLYVTEKATGVVTRYQTSVTVQSPYLKGWFILSENGGKTNLNFVRRDSWKDDDNKTHYYWTDFIDLYSQLHPNDPLASEVPVRSDVYVVGNEEDEVVVIYEGGRASVLNGLDFSKVLEIKDEFPGGAYPVGFEAKQFIRGGYCDFVLGTDGKLYWRKNANSTEMKHEQMFMDVAVYFPGGGADISEFFNINVYAANFILGYDQLHKRFVACYTSFNSGNSYLGGKMDIINPIDPTTFVDILNLEGYKLLYCGDFTDGTNYVNILKQESTGKYLMQTYKLSGGMNSLSVTNASQEEFAGSDKISDNTVFWKLRKASYLYFGEGNRLYFYDMSTKAVKLYASLPDGGNITHLMESPSSGGDYLLGVATDKGYFYLINATDAEILGSPDPGAVGIQHEVSGLGNIKSVSWKWGGYFNLVFDRY
ncbi:PKD-like family lipoprotein [Gabonibacter chumensis]|uniref:PKD-like family lipoprotein n=1 Tax=Gabonibacter chumensis TaxID=2972474 RepID=UPI002572B75F|nr:PKD-like family lipoprotein [Gabonibacter chumensis]MCR9012496.1 PKD-like family lipoprotein [Gabonibacter chumensis]